MSGFKLLAIRPLVGCGSKFLKVLKPNMLYKFYNNIEFKDFKNVNITGSGEQVYNILNIDDFSNELYSIIDLDNPLSINISAIIGGNGSGKSSLCELFYASIYAISIQQGFLANKDSLRQEIESLQEKVEKSLERMGKRERTAKGRISTPALERYYKEIEANKEKIKLIDDILPKVKVELYYSINGKFYCLHIDTNKRKLFRNNEGNVKHTSLFDETNSFDGKLFYTIALNYSSYGLNSDHLGTWVETLFHKNDGYKTPLVVNPMRTRGNYDINIETHLSQTRVLSNIVNESVEFRKLLEEKSIHNIVFRIDPKRKEELLSKRQQRQSSDLLKRIKLSSQELIELLFFRILRLSKNQISEVDYKSIKHINLIENYIIRKLFKIARIYEEYTTEHYRVSGSGLLPYERLVDFEGYIKKLGKDKSHKTLKIRQILWLIFNNTFKENEHKKVKWENDVLQLSVTSFKELLVGTKNKLKCDIKELIPVAFYSPQIIVTNESTYELLSSGEQQLVNALHTIYYHLNNLDSVFNSINQDRHEYKDVCILLDEIELYFHPNFQRRFIQELILGLKQLNLKNIKNINILFCTHSPFILSDIPTSNTIRLEKGIIREEKTQTFGANVHELLANKFFMDDGFMGEFAKEKITTCLNWLNSENPVLEQDKEFFKQLIEYIGEPIIKDRLLDLYRKKIGQPTYEELAKELELYKRK